jgi:hypothetical protein
VRSGAEAEPEAERSAGMARLLYREYVPAANRSGGLSDPLSISALLLTALNLRRIFNILPKNVLQVYLKGLACIFGQLFVLLGFHSFVLPKALFQSQSAALFFAPRLQPIKMRYFRW